MIPALSVLVLSSMEIACTGLSTMGLPEKSHPLLGPSFLAGAVIGGAALVPANN